MDEPAGNYPGKGGNEGEVGGVRGRVKKKKKVERKKNSYLEPTERTQN